MDLGTVSPGVTTNGAHELPADLCSWSEPVPRHHPGEHWSLLRAGLDQGTRPTSTSQSLLGTASCSATPELRVQPGDSQSCRGSMVCPGAGEPREGSDPVVRAERRPRGVGRALLQPPRTSIRTKQFQMFWMKKMRLMTEEGRQGRRITSSRPTRAI